MRVAQILNKLSIKLLVETHVKHVKAIKPETWVAHFKHLYVNAEADIEEQGQPNIVQGENNAENITLEVQQESEKYLLINNIANEHTKHGGPEIDVVAYQKSRE